MGELIVVAGTGTGVGKTVVTCAAAVGARSAGRDVVALKPLQTGIDRPSDADLLGSACGRFVAPLYSYPEPISPHLAARIHGATHTIDSVRAWVSARAREVTLVETAGGLFSPVSDSECNADLVRACGPSLLILVCSARLGVFHDVRATITAFRWANALTPILVVPSSPSSMADAVECSRELTQTILPATRERGSVFAFGPASAVDPVELWAGIERAARG